MIDVLLVIHDRAAALVHEIGERSGEPGTERAVGQQDRRRHRRDNTAVSGGETGYARINDADLYYEISGDGPAVVLLHGGLCDLRQWDDLALRLAGERRVIRYDRRGHGRSSFPQEPYGTSRIWRRSFRCWMSAARTSSRSPRASVSP